MDKSCNIGSYVGGLSLERLTPEHDLSGFDCDNSEINEFLHKDATRYQKYHLAQTYVLVTEDSTSKREVVGYFTLSAFGIQLPEEMVKPFRQDDKYHPYQPAVLVGMLGRSKKHAGYKLGPELMKLAILKTFKIQNELGIRFMVVHAHIRDYVVKMYNDLGFVEIPDKTGKKTKTMILDLYSSIFNRHMHK